MRRCALTRTWHPSPTSLLRTVHGSFSLTKKEPAMTHNQPQCIAYLRGTTPECQTTLEVLQSLWSHVLGRRASGKWIVEGAWGGLVWRRVLVAFRADFKHFRSLIRVALGKDKGAEVGRCAWEHAKKKLMKSESCSERERALLWSVMIPGKLRESEWLLV